MVTPLVAFGLTLLLCPVALAALGRWRVLDVPSARSSHTSPIVRGGGIAPAVGALVALALSTSLPTGTRVGLLVAGCGFAAIGLADDLVGVPALRRLALQAVAAIATVPWLTSSMDGSPVWVIAFSAGAALWLVAYVNAFNFMDGINGISAAQVIAAGTTWYVVGEIRDLPALSVPAVIGLAAALAFLPFNFPMARMFLGDVGSYFLGAWLAATAVGAISAGVPPETVLAPLSLYLADTGLTLVRRFRQRESLHAPHRDHTYQRLVRSGWSHTRTTLFVAAVMATTSALGGLALSGSVPLRVTGDALLACCLVAYVRVPTMARHGADAVAGTE